MVIRDLKNVPVLTQTNPFHRFVCISLKSPFVSTGLFISSSGISELDCATTKTDTAERSVSIGRESLQVFFVLGALAYFQVPPLAGSHDEKWRSQWIRKRSVSWNLPKTESIVTVQRRFRIMYHTEPPTDKTIREWYMNSSRVAACALWNKQAVRAYGPRRVCVTVCGIMHPRCCRPTGRQHRFAAHRQPLCWNSCTIHELFCL